MWNRFFLVGGGGHENFYLLNVCCLGGLPKNLLGVEGGLPKKFFLICKILIAPHHINYECSLTEYLTLFWFAILVNEYKLYVSIQKSSKDAKFGQCLYLGVPLCYEQN